MKMVWTCLLLGILATGIRADQGQTEVVLFHKADTDGNYMLTKHELDDLFLLFDANNNSEITPTEFVNGWANLTLGGPQQAQALFSRADTDDNGVIDNKDIPAIFTFFDMNGDGEVDISEFLTQWGVLEKEPSNNTIDVSVDVTG